MIGSPEVANVRDSTRDQEVPYNDGLRRPVKNTYANHAKQAVDISELQREDLRGRSQRNR